MNSELYLKASELAEAIHNSPEAIEVREAEKKIREDKVANNLNERWQKVYQRVQKDLEEGKELSEQDQRSIEFIEAKVENHPVLLNYMAAHNKFTALLQEINNILTGALQFDTADPEEDACITCPAHATCKDKDGNTECDKFISQNNNM
ncbi:protein of unknown function DUF964 [Syntrophobotulus glycolicus DSM 8271]|uniref:YlbF family regulator n=1 Tax=Syntrophobotulus glycolicus (strain DSM 8271 / FlGlyR) TaxID=645991 RepID=F0SZI4_SYNGF|nr:YlbF family regulator [Syntrophobotulus glycolicus]ADY56070.1 protein of unknown function DUF964 [Syntrophobotulus glycolicus DSM 8271]